MNEIETMFSDAYGTLYGSNKKEDELILLYGLEAQVPIGIYRVDFVVGGCCVVEIDGHEFHKTKEQREVDYRRERHLLKQGYIPVRFMASEVFNDAERCVREAFEICDFFEMKDIELWQKGMARGEQKSLVSGGDKPCR